MWPSTLSDALRMIADQDLVYATRGGHLQVVPRAAALVPWLDWDWLKRIAQPHVHADPEGGEPWLDWDRVAVDVGVADPEVAHGDRITISP